MATIDIIGGIFIDVYIFKDNEYYIHGSNIMIIPGGSGLNVAIGLSKLGHKVRIFGNIGNDFMGEYCLKILSEYAVDTNWIQKLNYPTPTFITINEKPLAVSRKAADIDILLSKNKADYLFITTEVNSNIVNSSIFMNYKKTFFDIGPRPKIITKKYENVIYIGNEKECEIFSFNCDIVKLGLNGVRWGDIKLEGNKKEAPYKIGMGDVFDIFLIDGILNNKEKEIILKSAMNKSESVMKELGALNKIIKFSKSH